MHKCIITRSSKFARHSLFSSKCFNHKIIGFNNLFDVTTLKNFATLYGFTKEDLKANLDIMTYIESIGGASGKNAEEVLEELYNYYDGYRFCPDSNKKVVNPFSFMRCLSTWYAEITEGVTWHARIKDDPAWKDLIEKYPDFPDMAKNYPQWRSLVSKDPKQYAAIEDYPSLLKEPFPAIKKDYWFASGTTTVLIRSLYSYPLELFRKDEAYLDERSLEHSRLAEEYGKNPILELYQSGYLAVTGEKVEGKYKLTFPNEEVRKAFKEELIRVRKELYPTDVVSILRGENYEGFAATILRHFRERKEEQLRNEHHYKCSLYHMIDSYIEKGEACFVEAGISGKATSKGVPDIIALIKMGDDYTCVVFELKHTSSGKVNETATYRKYLEKAKEEFKDRVSKISKYISIDLVSNYTNLIYMEVHELKDDAAEPTLLYRYGGPSDLKKGIVLKNQDIIKKRRKRKT